MRVSFSTALNAAVAAVLVASVPQAGPETRLVAQSRQGSAHEFAGAKLTAPPTTGWPTNGGNLYNQRYSPLKASNRSNVTQL